MYVFVLLQEKTEDLSKVEGNLQQKDKRPTGVLVF